MPLSLRRRQFLATLPGLCLIPPAQGQTAPSTTLATHLETLARTEGLCFVFTSLLREIALPPTPVPLSGLGAALKPFEIDLIRLTPKLYYVKDSSPDRLPFLSPERLSFNLKYLQRGFATAGIKTNSETSFRRFFDALPKEVLNQVVNQNGNTEPSGVNFTDAATLAPPLRALLNQVVLSHLNETLERTLPPVLHECELLQKNRAYFTRFDMAGSGVRLFGLHLFPNSEKPATGMDFVLHHQFSYQAGRWTSTSLRTESTSIVFSLGANVEPKERVVGYEKDIIATVTLAELVKVRSLACIPAIAQEVVAYIGERPALENGVDALLPLLRLRVHSRNGLSQLEPLLPTEGQVPTNFAASYALLFPSDFENYITFKYNQPHPKIDTSLAPRDQMAQRSRRNPSYAIAQLYQNSRAQLQQRIEPRLENAPEHRLDLAQAGELARSLVALLYFFQFHDSIFSASLTASRFLSAPFFALYPSRDDSRKYHLYLGFRETGSERVGPLSAREYFVN